MRKTAPTAARRAVAARPWRRLGVLAALALLGGCAAQRTNQAMLDTLAEMQIRLRLLQTELSDVHQAMADGDSLQAQRGAEAQALESRLDDLQQRLGDLPAQMKVLCPAPPAAATVTTQCETPHVQRVVVSGDKLVVGEVERVWVEPLAEFFEARIDPGASHSLLNVHDVVEFERDGNKWLRFGLQTAKETSSVERPLKRVARVRDDKRPMVELRVQLGDVRETVEFALMTQPDQQYPLVLGRNFLTDVALVDVARKHVQPAFKAGAQ